jgi:hypothetical protein
VHDSAICLTVRGYGFHLLVQYARRTRHPDLPDVPTARELARDAKGRELIVFAETPLLTMARPFLACCAAAK